MEEAIRSSLRPRRALIMPAAQRVLHEFYTEDSSDIDADTEARLTKKMLRVTFSDQSGVKKAGAPEAVIGDSAGAALALLTVQRARDAGLPLPNAIVLISPWLDLSMRGESYARLADRDIFSKPAQLRAMARSYLGARSG